MRPSSLRKRPGPFSARTPRFLATFFELPTIPPIPARAVAFFSNIRRFRQADPPDSTVRPCRRPAHGVAAISDVATPRKNRRQFEKSGTAAPRRARFARGAGHAWPVSGVSTSSVRIHGRRVGMNHDYGCKRERNGWGVGIPFCFAKQWLRAEALRPKR